jgi:hypothetical protein
MIGERKCDTYIQWSTIQPQRRMELYHFRKINETGELHVKQDKPSSERQILHVLSHMQNLDLKCNNSNTMTLF